jgi:RND family efflux transporter MFP subunit
MRLELCLCVVCALVACKRAGHEAEDEHDEAPAGPKHVRCASAENVTVSERVELRGTVAPPLDKDTQLAPQVAGRLLAVDVREGDGVTAGKVVARVDDAPLSDAASQADAAVAKARAEAENAQTTHARAKRVFEHGIAARQEVDDAAARETSAKAAVTEAEAAARVAHRQLERAQVRSPLSGVVLKVLRKPGELVDGTPGTPVVEVADLSQLELAADAPAQDLMRLQKGNAAAVVFSALPGVELKGEVVRVAPAVDRTTGTGTVRVALGAGDRARPPVGVLGTARVETGGPHEATLVPVAALRSVSGAEGEIIVCGDDRVAHVLRVQPGPTREGRVELRGGLDAGTFVVVDPVLGVSDGDSLEVEK